MPDTKITALTALTAADPANDMMPIVDVSDTSMAASGTTKRISINNILACSPSATLASATITGDLTVDTNTLKVDSTNNRVGIGTATPNWLLSLVGSSPELVMFDSGGNGTRLYTKATNTAVFIGSSYSTSAVPVNFTLDGGSSNAMTLNATGLGVGTASPAYKLDVNGVARVNSGGDGLFLSSASSPDLYIVGTNYYNNNGTEGVQVLARPSWKIEHKNTSDALAYLDIGFRAASAAASAFTSRFKIDGSGNVGIGVTPITPHILSAAGPLGITGTFAGTRTSYITNSSAASIYYTDGGGSGYFTDFGNLIIQPRTSAARSVVIATGSTTPVERAVVKSTGQVRFVPLAADPAGAEAGDVYYNSTSNKLKCYNGTTWNDLF